MYSNIYGCIVHNVWLYKNYTFVIPAAHLVYTRKYQNTINTVHRVVTNPDATLRYG